MIALNVPHAEVASCEEATTGFRSEDHDFSEGDDASTISGLEGDSHSTMKVISFAPQKTEWTKQDERRFDRLAVKAALEELTDKEARDLRILERERMSLLCARSAEEIAHDFKQRRVTRELVSALNNYVAFFGSDKKAPQSR